MFTTVSLVPRRMPGRAVFSKYVWKKKWSGGGRRGWEKCTVYTISFSLSHTHITNTKHNYMHTCKYHVQISYTKYLNQVPQSITDYFGEYKLINFLLWKFLYYLIQTIRKYILRKSYSSNIYNFLDYKSWNVLMSLSKKYFVLCCTHSEDCHNTMP